MRCGANGLRSARWRCFGAALKRSPPPADPSTKIVGTLSATDSTAQALQGSGERLDIRLGIAAGSTSVLGEVRRRCAGPAKSPGSMSSTSQDDLAPARLPARRKAVAPAPPPAGVDN